MDYYFQKHRFSGNETMREKDNKKSTTYLSNKDQMNPSVNTLHI